jgi:hypothetical protein
MGTSVTCQVLDRSGSSIVGPAVVARDESALFSGDLGNAVKDGKGNYTLSVGTELTPRLNCIITGPRCPVSSGAEAMNERCHRLSWTP